MYGLLLRALQDYILVNFDPAAWERVRAAGGFSPNGFEPLLPYSHDIARIALRETSRELQRPVPVILEDLGTWVVAAAYNGAARRLLRFCGADFSDFLLSLGELPDRARLALPDLSLPDLHLEELGEGQFRLYCHDGWPELGWILQGALRALADDYGALVLIEEEEASGASTSALSIRLLESRFSEGRRFDLSQGRAGGSRRLSERNGRLAARFRFPPPGQAAEQVPAAPVAPFGGGGDGPTQALTLARTDIEKLFPLCLVLGEDGIIRSAGPLMQRIFQDVDLKGRRFSDHFVMRGGATGPASAPPRAMGQRIRLEPLCPGDGQKGGGSGLRLRGITIALGQSGEESAGVLIALSFGIDIIRAVGMMNLTDADFAVTDMAMELLCLAEANDLAMAGMRALSSRLEGARAQAEDEALTDALTGLRNRRACDSYLARLCREGTPFTLMHLDLDFFKEVNDRHGHAAGDAVLIAVAKTLTRHLRSRDFIARVGGDEFLIILPGLAGAGRQEDLAGRIIEEIAMPVRWQDVFCQISGSIGMVDVAKGARPEPARLLDLADRLLYAAKAAGRGRVIGTGFSGTRAEEDDTAAQISPDLVPAREAVK